MASKPIDLCDFEIELLRSMAGEKPGQPWGAAIGAALGFLKGSGYVTSNNGAYSVTDAGRAVLKELNDGKQES